MTNVHSGKVGLGIVLGLVALAAAAGATRLPALGSAEATGPREIRLVVRDMTFYIEGQDMPNPTLKLRAGEEVRLILQNDDPGMDHDFTVRTWKVATRLLEGKAEDAIEFRVPEARGTETYTCTPHSQMMRGTIVVE